MLFLSSVTPTTDTVTQLRPESAIVPADPTNDRSLYKESMTSPTVQQPPLAADIAHPSSMSCPPPPPLRHHRLAHQPSGGLSPCQQPPYGERQEQEQEQPRLCQLSNGKSASTTGTENQKVASIDTKNIVNDVKNGKNNTNNENTKNHHHHHHHHLDEEMYQSNVIGVVVTKRSAGQKFGLGFQLCTYTQQQVTIQLPSASPSPSSSSSSSSSSSTQEEQQRRQEQQKEEYDEHVFMELNEEKTTYQGIKLVRILATSPFAGQLSVGMEILQINEYPCNGLQAHDIRIIFDNVSVGETVTVFGRKLPETESTTIVDTTVVDVDDDIAAITDPSALKTTTTATTTEPKPNDDDAASRRSSTMIGTFDGTIDQDGTTTTKLLRISEHQRPLLSCSMKENRWWFACIGIAITLIVILIVAWMDDNGTSTTTTTTARGGKYLRR